MDEEKPRRRAKYGKNKIHRGIPDEKENGDKHSLALAKLAFL